MHQKIILQYHIIWVVCKGHKTVTQRKLFSVSTENKHKGDGNDHQSQVKQHITDFSQKYFKQLQPQQCWVSSFQNGV